MLERERASTASYPAPASNPCARCPLDGVSRGPCPFRPAQRRAGSLLIAHGEIPDSVMLVRSGTVLHTAVSPDGEETLCALRGPGALVGLELLRAAPTRSETWALTDVQMCRLDGGAVAEWLGPMHSPLGALLELSLAELATREVERVALSGRALRRTARFLVEHHGMHGDRVALHVEQQVLARMLGMRPETLSRALARLRQLGALAPGRGLRVIDEKRLREVAGEEEPAESRAAHNG